MSADIEEEDTMSVNSHWTVTGMSCGHCVTAVDEEVRQIDGVTDVEIDLASGSVSVTSDAPLGTDAMAVAVAEAGYELASS